MLGGLRDRLDRRLHDLRCRGILATPPLAIRPAPLAFCSLVSQRDLIMYLVAIKSVYRQVGEGTIHVINDGSLTADGIAALNHHLGDPVIVPIASVDTGACPRGGCWERLLHILDLSRDRYVIQVDSDIVARRAMAEVTQSYRANRSFTLGTRIGQRIISTAEASANVAASTTEHIQITAERALAGLGEAETRRYVRGCAGFAGFAAGAVSRAAAAAFSQGMQAQIGPRWSTWGTEQVASNYLIANAPDALVLPWPRYASYYPEVSIPDADLVHFLNQHRFEGGHYARESRAVISALTRGRPAA